MSFIARASRLLPLPAILAVSSPAGAEPVSQRATSPALAPRPAAGATAIIPLPLNPVVPAAQRSCTTRTASGLGVTLLRPGTGATPPADATVLVNYIGYLATDGSVFDQGMRSPLPVAEVIRGFGEGLQQVSRNGIVRLCVPAALGYGAQASGPIPANADLVFQVELLDFKTAAEIAALREAAAAPPAPAAPAAPADAPTPRP